MLAGKVQVNGQTFYLPLLPCTTDFAKVPALTIPAAATLQDLSSAMLALLPQLQALRCNGTVYDFSIPPPPAEICGNCLDDDGNGLVDFEDTACCGGTPPRPMTIRQASLKPKGNGSRVALKTIQTVPGLGTAPTARDLFLQIRPDAGSNPFCAHLPADHVRRKGKTLRFKDPRGRLSGAGGLNDLTLTVKRNGTVQLTTRGKQTTLHVPAPGALRVALGVSDPASPAAGAVCSAVTAPFKKGKKGALRSP
jgi:hypothetical protein